MNKADLQNSSANTGPLPTALNHTPTPLYLPPHSLITPKGNLINLTSLFNDLSLLKRTSKKKKKKKKKKEKKEKNHTFSSPSSQIAVVVVREGEDLDA